MSKLGYARSFRDLLVYQKARAVAKDIFAMSRGFPAEERYSLTDQVRRSSRSVGAQIAEAWARRKYPRHFESKLSDADGEQLETQHWIDTAADCSYVAAAQAVDVNTRLCEVGRMLNAMMQKAEDFCQEDVRMVREEQALYFVSTPCPSSTEH